MPVVRSLVRCAWGGCLLYAVAIASVVLGPGSTGRGSNGVVQAVEARRQGPGLTPPGDVKALAAGKLLVASRDLLDPNFAETVVLLVDYRPDGAAGLVVNVRTDVPLARLFGHLDLGANALSRSFSGGPVARDSALALMRSRPAMAGARPVAADVHLVASRDALEELLTTDADADRFRVYLGRSGWGPGQLDRETLRGAWHILPAEANLVFDPNPATLWRRLIRSADVLLVRRAARGGGCTSAV
jgi:putative transcriptional regulator